MSTHYRLSYLDAELANQLARLPRTALRQISLTSAELAIGASDLREPLVRGALDQAKATWPDGLGSHHLKPTVDRLDQDYFGLKQAYEEGRAEEGLFHLAFRRARAAAAAMFALSADPLDASMDALYEAHAAGVPIATLRIIVDSASLK